MSEVRVVPTILAAKYGDTWLWWGGEAFIHCQICVSLIRLPDEKCELNVSSAFLVKKG